MVLTRMFGLFKEKLKAEDAAVAYLQIVSNRIQETWDSDIREINSILGEETLLTDQFLAQFELFIAVIALELNVVMNKIPEKYDIIYKSLLQFLLEQDETGDYAVNTITSEYIPAIKRSELDQLPPFNDLVFILADKLELSGRDVIIGSILSKVVMAKVGTWKQIIDRYKII